MHEKGTWVQITAVLIAISIVITALPAARLSDRFGRKAVIYGACALGALGMSILVVAPTLPIAESGILLLGIGAGAFLAVDWALMTDIIPKAASGRYMGMSNVATASAGAFALIIGGPIIDIVGGPEETGAGPRAALMVGVVLFVIAAALLRPVDERRREDSPSSATAITPEPAT